MTIFTKSIFLIAFMFCFYGKAIAFYCGNTLVTEGNSTAEVSLKCGAPTWIEQHEDIMIDDIDPYNKRRKTIITEEWTYNFGKNSWLYLLRFKNGILKVIETRGYGYEQDEAFDRCDNGRNISVGETTAEVTMKCGEPFHRSYREDAIRTTSGFNSDQITYKAIKDWTYDFRPNGWIYFLRFENGILVNIETK
jgi:hypothetical protein